MARMQSETQFSEPDMYFALATLRLTWRRSPSTKRHTTIDNHSFVEPRLGLRYEKLSPIRRRRG